MVGRTPVSAAHSVASTPGVTDRDGRDEPRRTPPARTGRRTGSPLAIIRSSPLRWSTVVGVATGSDRPAHWFGCASGPAVGSHSVRGRTRPCKGNLARGRRCELPADRRKRGILERGSRCVRRGAHRGRTVAAALTVSGIEVTPSGIDDRGPRAWSNRDRMCGGSARATVRQSNARVAQVGPFCQEVVVVVAVQDPEPVGVRDRGEDQMDGRDAVVIGAGELSLRVERGFRDQPTVRCRWRAGPRPSWPPTLSRAGSASRSPA